MLWKYARTGRIYADLKKEQPGTTCCAPTVLLVCEEHKDLRP
jgi:hypothetical protein